MKIEKWGDSLAVRIPQDVVDALGLKENDEMRLVRSADGLKLEAVSDAADQQARREAALKRLREFRGSIPADYKFDREEANSRGPGFSESE